MKKFWYSLILKLYWRIDPKRIKTNLGLKMHSLIFHRVEDAWETEFDIWNSKHDSTLKISDSAIVERLI